MINFMFMLLCTFFGLINVEATDKLPTMQDGILGIAFDNILSASEVFVIFMLGAFIAYKASIWMVKRHLHDFEQTSTTWKNIVNLVEVYMKAAIIPAAYGIIANSSLRLDRSFVLYDYCSEYVYITSVGLLFLLAVYAFLLPDHDHIDVLRVSKQDSIKIYNTFSRLFISTITMCCFLNLTKKMTGIDYLTADMVCRSILCLHIFAEILHLKGILHSISIRRKVAYVGPVAALVRYINQKIWVVACLLVAALYAHEISCAEPHFKEFITDISAIMAALVVSQIIAIHILEFATAKSLKINLMDIKLPSKKFKRHIYETANVAISLIYFSVLYSLIAYLFVDPVSLMSGLTILYSTVKAVIQLYVVFFLYRCIDLSITYKSESMYMENSARAKTLRSILPVAIIAIRCTVVCLGLMMILANYGVDLSPVYAVLVAVGLALSKASKESLESYVKGFMLLLDDNFAIGEYIKVGGVIGTVEDIGLWSLKIREHSGVLNVIPYASIGVVSNFSRDFTNHVLEIYCPNDIDFSTFKQLLHETCQDLQKSESIAHMLFAGQDLNYIRVKDFDDLGTTLKLTYKSKPENTGAIVCEFNSILRKKLTEKGIPYPKCVAKSVNVVWNAYLNNA